MGSGWTSWQAIDVMYPIIKIYAPTRWERLKAWMGGRPPKSIVIRKVF